jgi:hypothetical protein
VFPVLVFAAAVTLMIHGGAKHHDLDVVKLLVTVASCAVPGGLIYIRWWRQQSRIAGSLTSVRRSATLLTGQTVNRA